MKNPREKGAIVLLVLWSRRFLFLRRTYDLIVTFIRHHPNMRVGPSFLIQILKFGREAQYCPSRGLKPQRPLTGSLAEYVKAVFASLFLFYWVFYGIRRKA